MAKIASPSARTTPNSSPSATPPAAPNTSSPAAAPSAASSHYFVTITLRVICPQQLRHCFYLLSRSVHHPPAVDGRSPRGCLSPRKNRPPKGPHSSVDATPAPSTTSNLQMRTSPPEFS